MPPRYDQHTKGSALIREFAPSIAGKIILVTGTAPKGIGALFCTAIAQQTNPDKAPRLIILTGRTTASIAPTRDAIKESNPAIETMVLAMDLGSLKSVREAAALVNSDEWAREVPHIDLLVNNAGIMACPYATTAEGFESQFGVNHLGHFLFTNMIMGKLLKAAAPRVVAVSSTGHRVGPIRWGDVGFKDGQCYNKWTAYGQSKTANCLFALALARKLGSKGLQAYSLCPGAYMTNLGRHLDWSETGDALESLRTVDEIFGNPMCHEGFDHGFTDADGIIANHVFVSFNDDIKGFNGGYFKYCHYADQAKDEVWPWANSAIEADRLWRLSENMVGQEFPY
ncbi:uncharacterized protein B0I36DRAFT_294989 [Microdochium trichocladiopsis]|uniref:Short-chain dehydrogenase n=1 Tax=Microdochium trichocladiopsis TaxID=1682393 RepID=A0A9P9BKY7_9PEZI|nr:uncharacterized protein B0I36DRAFT_294989 [Microdochium trichocladiopsis]KAH7024387.1 hypothetical protein B0I36DRAFT_294989 [Microdochium trichocladiopsis]